MSPSPTHASEQDGARETNHTTSKLKKRRIQITENSPKALVASNKSFESCSHQNSPVNPKTTLPLKSKVISPVLKTEFDEESPTKVGDTMESKALIKSPTSTTKIRPVPLKTSPNRTQNKSPSSSPMRI